MSSDIEPGDFVECVARGRGDGFAYDGPAPVVGSVYVVTAVLRTRSTTGRVGVGLQLAGMPTVSKRGRPGAWGIERFRPIYRPKSSLIEDLKVSERIGEGDEIVRANKKEVA